MQQNLKLRLLSYIVITYMLVAFLWWSVLLFTKNRDAFNAKTELNKLVMVASQQVTNEEAYYQTSVYKDLKKNYQRQEWMILGEASLFIISLVIGVWLINRGYYREMLSIQQRRNFLLSITHELKSPIASIRLIYDTFLRRNLAKEQIDLLSKNGIKETERLHTLVNDLLLSAKLENGYQPYKEIFDIDGLVIDLVQQQQIIHPKMTFVSSIEEDLPTYWGDVQGMSSVIINLLENAVKYSFDKEAEIEVNLKQKDNKNLLLEIADNGIGISDEEKKNVFEKFYRVGNEDTRRTKGTGLGLYIVHEIIKNHGGKIKILDNQPKGTIFSITLPIAFNKSKTTTEEVG